MGADDSFLQAILDSPDDASVRLVYADWLEERGDPRSEYLRLQWQLTQLPRPVARPRDLIVRLAQLRRQLDPVWLEAIHKNSSVITAEEYAVYTAVCHNRLGINWRDGDTTFADQTVSDRETQNPDDHLRGLIRYRCLKHPEMLDDFAVKNAQPWPLEKRFEGPNNYQLLSVRGMAELDHPRSVCRLSRVGFGRQGELALVYLERFFSKFLLFERTEQGWHLKDPEPSPVEEGQEQHSNDPRDPGPFGP